MSLDVKVGDYVTVTAPLMDSPSFKPRRRRRLEWRVETRHKWAVEEAGERALTARRRIVEMYKSESQ